MLPPAARANATAAANAAATAAAASHTTFADKRQHCQSSFSGRCFAV
jgi:hypothetical protein